MSAEFREGLENQLLERHGEIYAHAAQRAGVGRGAGTRRPAYLLAAAAAFVVTIAIGSIPVSFSMGLGRLVSVHLPAGAPSPPEPVELQRRIESLSGAEELSVSVSHSSQGESTVMLLLFGSDVGKGELVPRLQEALPTLRSGQWSVETLDGEITTSLARKIGHDVFSIQVHTNDVEQARREILRDLAARGIGDGTVVQVRKAGNRKQIDVHLPGDPSP